MGHDWIYDVLRDLAIYARANGLPALAAKADEALKLAEAEIALQSGGIEPHRQPEGSRRH